ncbi:MAG: ATP-binding protein [Acidimicrobiia bacterium]|nr:ATP-binding protein [Acidimicrobiia bacterium]
MSIRTSLRTKLGLALLAVALVPTVVASVLVFTTQRSTIIDDRLERLRAIATVQQSRIEAWVAASEDNVALIASRTRFRIELRDMQDRVISEVDRQVKLNTITGILEDASGASQNVVEVHALDRSGRVVASTSALRVGSELADAPYLAGAGPDDPSVSHVDGSGDELVGVHGGFVELDGEHIGWVVIEQRLEALVEVLEDRSGLGSTGEAVLVRRDGFSGPIVSIGPLKSSAASALAPLPTGDGVESAAVRVLDGDHGNAVDAVDYRGEPVIAATRPIDGTDWGLVVKQDRSEILAATNGLRNTLVVAAAAVTALAMTGAWLVARQLTRNIGDLTATARRVARGDRSARAKVATRDELAELAVAFNRMTDDLVGHEAELETRKTQLESFLYVSSHDLKTPLRSISSFSQLLRLDFGPGLDDRAGHYLERIEQGATRTIDVIDDLLAYVRVDHVDHESEQVDLTAAAVDARDLLGPIIAEKHAEVRIGELGHIEGNQPLIVQLFQNLIGNALKFARDGVPPVIDVTTLDRANGDGPALRLVVADNGVGVPPEHRTRIFAPFERLHSADEVPGTGLGLAVCQRIVALHDGTIEFADSPLGGAAVEVTLACREAV